MIQDKQKLLKTYSNPQLKEPFFVAAGPGTSNVGLRTADYIREKLGAKLLAEIKPGDFFTPPYSLTFREGLVDVTPIELGEHTPQNRFYYWKSGKEHDVLFFIGNAHPLPGKVLELAEFILDVARGFGFCRLFMPGAFLTDVHHLSKPNTYGLVTDNQLQEYLRSYHIAAVPTMNIAHNLNAWLVGSAKRKNIEAIGLVSEIPVYNPEGSNVRACRALVKILLRMLDIGVPDLSDLDAMLTEEEVLMEQWIAKLRESTDQRTIEFLQYLEMLENREHKMPKDEVQLKVVEALQFPAILIGTYSIGIKSLGKRARAASSVFLC